MSYTNIQERRLPFAIRYLVDVFNFRHLCWNLVGSDLRARFRRSRLGILWAIIMPLGFSLIVATVWGSVFAVKDYWTFAIYVFSGMVTWEYFNTSMMVSQDSLVSAEGYLKQARVPFLIFQLRTPFTAFVILLCGILGLLVLMAALQKLPTFGLHLLLIPAWLGLILLFCIPIAILMSIIGAQFRDARHITALAMQALFFLTPVMLDRATLARPELQILHYINPVVPLLDMLRGPLLYSNMWELSDEITIAAWIGGVWMVAFIAQARAGRKLIFAL